MPRTTQRFVAHFQHEQAALAAALHSVPPQERTNQAAALLYRAMLLEIVHARGWLDGPWDAALLGANQGAVGALLQRLLPIQAGLAVGSEAVARLHAFVAQFRWQLDEHAPRAANTLSPHVFGALAEKQTDQKGTGTYYTDNDVAAYVATTAIIPALFDAVHARCGAAFDAVTWPLLQRDPTRYLFPALQHGANEPLPAPIAAGLAVVRERGAWDQPAPAAWGLARETWRDVVARREHHATTVAALAAGLVRSADACVSHNINLALLACDAIAASDQPLVEAWWHALDHLRVLDPTCGAGAFLLQAMRVLQPLRHACAERMSNRSPSVIHDIGARNLHGVDLLPEALAMCRLRLTLAAIAQADSPEAALDLPALPLRCGDVLLAPAVEHESFDVVIGNPPYLPYSPALQPYPDARYTTERSGNLYALVVEQSLRLLRPGGRLGMVVPIASVSTGTMNALQALYHQHTHWHSHFAVRPGKLFSGVDMNMTITLLHKTGLPAHSFSTGYRRWFSRAPSDRPTLFETLAYAEHPHPQRGSFPKHGSATEWQIAGRMAQHGRTLADYVAADGASLFYHSGGRYWRKALLAKRSSHYKPLRVVPALLPVVFGLLNSQLFHWYWISHSNCMDVVARDVLRLPVFALEHVPPAPFAAAMDHTLALYQAHSTEHARRGARIAVDEWQIDMRPIKPAIDAIDRLLAEAYGFSEEQLDFVLHYEGKYRAE